MNRSNPRSVLITGITGFVGSHLAEYLVKERTEDMDVFGLKRWHSPEKFLSDIHEEITLLDGDLRDLSSLVELFRRIEPDMVFHLAAQSYVPQSFVAPADTIETNVTGTVNLLEAIRLEGLDPVIHICSSSEVYGDVREEHIPIQEDCPIEPASPYGVSKIGEEKTGTMYHRAYDLNVVCSRTFNHSGPRRGKVFVDSSFSRQIAKMEQGLQEPVIEVGNLDSVRTFCDVRDIVRAYFLLLKKGEPGEVYNIGGEESMTIRELLDHLLDMTNYEGDIDVRVDEERLRPADVTLLVPDTTKFKELTDWSPRIPYRQTLADMLDYWREQVSSR